MVKVAQTGVGPDEPGDLARSHAWPARPISHELARYPDPLSPEAAARLVGPTRRSTAEVADRIRALAQAADLVLVEGAGGLLVRYDAEGTTVADLAHALRSSRSSSSSTPPSAPSTTPR